jgi:hypothetical protein
VSLSVWPQLKSIIGRCRRAIKKVAFGDTLLPQEFTIGLAEPQTEISVWLHAMAVPFDVTERQTTACTAPLTICVAFHEGQIPRENSLRKPVLKFCERGGRRRVWARSGCGRCSSCFECGVR